MHSLNDDERRMVLGEVIADELKAIHEYVSDLPEIKRNIIALTIDVRGLKADMNTVKTVITDHSRQLNSIDRRLTGLETSRYE